MQIRQKLFCAVIEEIGADRGGNAVAEASKWFPFGFQVGPVNRAEFAGDGKQFSAFIGRPDSVAGNYIHDLAITRDTAIE